MMGSTSLQLAVLKRRIQQVAPPVFAFLKALNRRREQLWRSPLVYGWRGRCFVLKERCTGFPALRRQFFGKTGYEIDLKSPRTFNQKISWLSAANHFFSGRSRRQGQIQTACLGLGQRTAWSCASRTLALVSRPSEIPWESLPPRVVLKATHASGAVQFVDRNQNDFSESIEPLLETWLQYPYGVYKHEWVYWPVRRRLLVEEWLDSDRASGLVDYKFHMSRGRCLAIQVNEGFQTGARTRSILTPDWCLHDVHWLYPRPSCCLNALQILKTC